MRQGLERRNHEIKGQMDNMVSLLDARLPLHGVLSFAHQFPYPIYPPSSMPAAQQGYFQYPERMNAWSYYPPRFLPDTVVYSYPNFSYHNSPSRGADIQLLSSPDMPQSNAALPQQQSLVQLGDSRRRHPSSQLSASSCNPSQQLSQIQCFSSSVEPPWSPIQQTTKQNKEFCKIHKSRCSNQVQHSSSTELPRLSCQKNSTLQHRKLHHTRLLRSSKSVNKDPSSSPAHQSSVHKVESVKKQRRNQSAKAKKQWTHHDD